MRLRPFKQFIKIDVSPLYSLNIPADLPLDELEPYFKELMEVIILESRNMNLVVKVQYNNELPLE